MPEHLLAIGLFVFGMDRLSFETLERSASWKHGFTDRFGARAAGQYLGPGEEKITLNGMLVPEIAGTFGEIERLREMAGAGEVYPVVLGDGTVLGHYRIVNVDDRWSNLIAGGRPRTTEFAVDLIRSDDETGAERTGEAGNWV